MGRGTRFTRNSGGLPITRSQGSDRVLLVRPLQSLAPDLEVKKSDSELGRSQTLARPLGIGMCSRGGKTPPQAADRRTTVRDRVRQAASRETHLHLGHHARGGRQTLERRLVP